MAYPEADTYKAEETRHDPRVTFLPVQHLTLQQAGAATVTADMLSRSGGRHRVTADMTYLSIGSAPTAPAGDLVRDADGYCPPAGQHPRIVVAGDLRSARLQRIMTALGSGSEAALHAYYPTRELLQGLGRARRATDRTRRDASS